MIGEYADEYEAYPLFQHRQAIVAFGVPFFYEHHRYNAIEATQRMITDMEKISNTENIMMDIHAGIYTGSILAGFLNTKGKNLKEYTLLGEGIENSERVALEAEYSASKLLVCERTLENMTSKFYSDKTYKVRLKNGKEIIVHKIRV